MPKSLGTTEQRHLIRLLVQMRTDAGYTQRDLAKAMKVSPSWIAKVETGERRLDVVEFCWWCKALDRNPANQAYEVVAAMTGSSRNRKR